MSLRGRLRKHILGVCGQQIGLCHLLPSRSIAAIREKPETLKNLADIKAEKAKRTTEKFFYFKSLFHKLLIQHLSLGRIRKKLVFMDTHFEDYILAPLCYWK